jgi:uncharacterized membrane protein HdeD (DUF308 family)
MSDPTTVSVEEHGSSLWVPILIVGIITAVIGGIVVWDPVTGLHAFVILVGLAFIAAGIGQMLSHPRAMPRWYSVVAGLVWLAAGLVVIVWPEATLWVLAVVIGVSQLIGGVFRIVVAFAQRSEHTGWLMISGILHVLLGLVVLAWPEATLQVIAFLIGLMILISGIFEIFLALQLRKAGTEWIS